MSDRGGAVRAALVAAILSLVLIEVGAQSARPDASRTAYESPLTVTGGPDALTPDDARARLEWKLERMGGELEPAFVEAFVVDAAAQPTRFPEAFASARAAGSPGQWFNIGPTRANWLQNGVRIAKSDTGRIRTVLPHPTNPDVVYLLTSGGGLWKTTDFTSPRPSWTPKSDFLPTTSGGSIAFGRTPDTLYLGLGDPFDAVVGGVMAKSTDGGETWTNITALTGLGLAATTVMDVQVDTSGPTDVVLVATNIGIFRSADGGASYIYTVNSAFPTLGFVSSAWSLARTSAGWLAAVRTSTSSAIPLADRRKGLLFVSTDKGATWLPIPNTGGVYTGAGRTTLGVGAPGDAVVYAFAAVRGDTAQLDLFRSMDGGLNWTAVGLPGKTPINPSTFQSDLDVMQGQAFYNHMVLVDPADPNRTTVYLGGQLASVRSLDGGATWRVLTDWVQFDKLPYVHADFHAAAISRASGRETLFFGTDGGLFISTDGAKSFSDQKNDGLASYLLYAITGNPKHDQHVLVGLQDNGTRLRLGRDTGGTYNQVFGGDGFGVAWSQANDVASIGSIYYSRLYRTLNNPPATQQKWEDGDTGIAETNNPALAYFVTPLYAPPASADPLGATFFTNTVAKLYKTTNAATSWTAIGVAGQNGWPAATVVRAVSHGVGVSPTNINRLGVAGSGGVVLLSSDGGASWVPRNLTALMPAGQWAGFNANVAFVNDAVVYVSADFTAATAGRVAKSTDGGLTWARRDSGLPRVPVYKLLVSPRDPAGNTLYAATALGVYVTTNGGESWSRFGNGLPLVDTTDIYMPTDGSYLRAATYGRSAWEVRF